MLQKLKLKLEFICKESSKESKLSFKFATEFILFHNPIEKSLQLSVEGTRAIQTSTLVSKNTTTLQHFTQADCC